LKAKIQEILAANKTRHFVLLLLDPGPSIEGVYVMNRGMDAVTKIWGDTPDVISVEETDRFWRYNDIIDQFVEQPEHGFTAFTDAITL
jgi:hypothetical protein